MSLYIYVADEELRNLYRQHLSQKHRYTDSGFDILLPRQTVTASNNQYIMGDPVYTSIIVAALTESGHPAPCLLLPRSSISSTILRLSNSIGLIDMGYRGEVIAKCDTAGLGVSIYHIDEQGKRLFQLVQHNFMPWKEIRLVNTMDELPLPPDNRGTGGFGSTGR